MAKKQSKWDRLCPDPVFVPAKLPNLEQLPDSKPAKKKEKKA